MFEDNAVDLRVSLIGVWLSMLLFCFAPQARAQVSFTTGQRARIALSAYGLQTSGGATNFNHPSGVTIIDGNLALADRNNNRVLIWEGIPSSYRQKPKVVLGQPNFKSIQSGAGLAGLNWPTDITTAGKMLFVADAYNDRILVWRTLPSTNQQPADFALSSVKWPWGLWSDGTKLIASSTGAGKVVIWNTLPDSDVAPDSEILIPEFGTPRTVASDGNSLIVSDHNAKNQVGERGTFLWNSFPSRSDAPFTYFTNLFPATTAISNESYEFNSAEFLSDGRLVALGGNRLCIWNSFPASASQECAVLLGAPDRGSFTFKAGDNSDVVSAEGKVLISLNNENKVLVFNTVPTSSGVAPDYAIGTKSTSPETVTKDKYITNPVPLTLGRSLIVSSDFDRTLSVWRKPPKRSGQKPNRVLALEMAPWDSTALGAGVAIAGQRSLYIWNSTPRSATPEIKIQDSIGSITFDNLRGVSYNGQYFFLADYGHDKVYVFDSIPTTSSNPIYTLDVPKPGRISSDAAYLAVSQTGTAGGGIYLYYLPTLQDGQAPTSSLGGQLSSERLNLPQDVLILNNSLIVADTGFNRAVVWNNVATAVQGQAADVYLGADDSFPLDRPAIAANRLFWPGALGSDGKFLWIGEYKFSNRLVGFRARK